LRFNPNLSATILSTPKRRLRLLLRCICDIEDFGIFARAEFCRGLFPPAFGETQLLLWENQHAKACQRQETSSRVVCLHQGSQIIAQARRHGQVISASNTSACVQLVVPIMQHTSTALAVNTSCKFPPGNLVTVQPPLQQSYAVLHGSVRLIFAGGLGTQVGPLRAKASNAQPAIEGNAGETRPAAPDFVKTYGSSHVYRVDPCSERYSVTTPQAVFPGEDCALGNLKPRGWQRPSGS
jgi:hypothetical protein